MEQNETRSQVAQPADEEIKKHGDPLAKLVREVAEGNESKDEASVKTEDNATGGK